MTKTHKTSARAVEPAAAQAARAQFKAKYTKAQAALLVASYTAQHLTVKELKTYFARHCQDRSTTGMTTQDLRDFYMYSAACGNIEFSSLTSLYEYCRDYDIPW